MRALLISTLALLSLACSSNEGDGGDATGGSGNATGGSGNGDCTPDYSCEPPLLPSTGDPAADCVARINQFRECACVPPLERWTEAEACADQQAEYDVENGAHAGFSDGICEPGGGAQNECPGWGSTEQVVEGCLQMMFDEGPADASCPEWCVEKGHHINMTNPSSTRVACGFHTTPSGDVWAIQNFD